MLTYKTLNHIKISIPYCTDRINKGIKRTFSSMNGVDYNYKKYKLNNRFQITSSYISNDISNDNLQHQHDVNTIRHQINKALIHKHDGYRRDGILFENILKIIYENEGYETIHTGGVNDAGVDLLIKKDNKKIAIQAKNYNDSMTSKYLKKINIKSIFKKIKNDDEKKYLNQNESFYSARLHIYNDNIVSIRPEFMESISMKYKYNLFEKGIYGKTWLLDYINYLSTDSITKFYELLNK